ncbi:catalase family peroxidase [Sphingomonas nostoxanthinifaciens]|uniref:catalase family peroxidase n=1 Tax=Sphingomonas nostoxanthinifaciens TaxID=2872652 RepID=UPI001CC1D0D9|nr:catalase family peroxidase [Sphingomonas nostoxanthinifaciens]UAK26262.1 catalase family peroxidase [Sphingomonas nostoxanthinifaciens]
MPSPTPRLPRMALIAAILALVILVFAWVGGFLSPGRVGGGGLADALQAANGKVYPGFRRAHAKGLCVSGRFEANGAGAALSRASLFPAGSVPVIGRFSTGGGNPMAPDGRVVFHALGLRFVLPHGERWHMALDHTPIFIASTVADFVALQNAAIPDAKTGKPDPAKMKAFAASHPETQAFLDYMKTAPLPSSFANGTYYSIDAFRFVDAQGQSRLVRWQFEPETPFAALDKATLDKQPSDFLFDDLLARTKQAPLRWHMILVVANPGDRTDNATVRWTGPHRQIDAGTLILDHAATETQGDCRDYNYDPLILPKGVAASDDPILAARSAAYSASFRRRTKEGPRVDAVTSAHATGGGQ